MKRRSFIKKSALGVPVVLNGVQAFGMSQFGMFSSLGQTDKVLVLIQLNGGNDGLNMLLPLDQYANLFKAREDIILRENDAKKLEDNLGIHPMMGGMENLYKEGLLSVVQAVGYPNQNRSHFRSKDIWMTGSPAEENYLTGWLGRHFEIDHPTFPVGYPNGSNPDPIAIAIGATSSKTCQGSVANFSLALTDPANPSVVPTGLMNPNLDGIYATRMDYLSTIYRQTNEYGSTISDAFTQGTDQDSNYEDLADNALSKQLNIVGRLIEGGMQTSVYVVQLGGFDTHGDQSESGDPSSGRHPILLDKLSKAISGFQKHIEAIGKQKKVLGMTFSEFGRRINANGSFGTDHGSAAPLFLFGDCVQGGVLGDNPTIGDNVQPQEGVAMQHDFRSVYATILRDWFELDENVAKGVLSQDVQFLPIISGCQTTSVNNNQSDSFSLTISPSPASNTINIDHEGLGAEAIISVFDGIGHLVLDISKKYYSVGPQRTTLHVGHLPSGPYFVRWQSGRYVKTERFIKG